MLARPWFLLPPVAAFGRAADRGRLVLPVDRRPVGACGLVDGTTARRPAGRRRQHQHRGGGSGAGPAVPPGIHPGDPTVRLRRRLRPGATVRRVGRPGRAGRGTHPRRPQVLHPAAAPAAGTGRPAPPPRRAVLLRRPGHLAGTRRGAPLRRRPVRAGRRARLAPAAPPPTHLPRPRRGHDHRGGHHHPRPGLPAARPPRPCSKSPVAMVDRTRGHRPGSGPGLAGLHPQIRSRDAQAAVLS
jgi:hypothetical protein